MDKLSANERLKTNDDSGGGQRPGPGEERREICRLLVRADGDGDDVFREKTTYSVRFAHKDHEATRPIQFGYFKLLPTLQVID